MMGAAVALALFLDDDDWLVGIFGHLQPLWPSSRIPLYRRQRGERLFDLVEGRAYFREQCLARKFGRNRRRIALHVSEQAGLDAQKIFGFGVVAVLQRGRDRGDETIGDQDAEERADER